MFDGGRSSHVEGAWPAGVQANPPTGTAIVVLVVVLVEDVVVDVLVEVGPDDVVVGCVVDEVVDGATVEPGVEVDVLVAPDGSPALVGGAAESVLVAHPATRNTSVAMGRTRNRDG
jgi:hypothetical protein